MQRKLLAMVTGLLALGLAGTAKAVPVDLQLSLVVDSSGSISNSEFTQQISGYAQAFQQAPVINSIVNSPNGIAVNTILFASSATEVLAFRQLQTEAEIAGFVNDLQAINRIGGGTNIPSGINLAVETIANNNFESGNIIIDVSGDGASSTAQTQAARDAALLAGVSRINGLAIGSEGIRNFYENNVIGGPGSFVLLANSFDEFEAAIATKIGIEVGGPDPVRVPEPGVVSMLGLGFMVLGFAMRRRKRA